MLRYCTSLLILMFVGSPSYAQKSVRDTSITLVPITASYAYQSPGANMAERFGNNSNIGLSAGVKFKNNYLIGVQGSFIFGTDVLEPGLMSNIIDSDGAILNQEGQPANVLTMQRGYTITGFVGRIMPIVGPNLNSGLMLRLGAGYMRHKIRIETQNDLVPQLEGDALDGYDRLSAGPMAMLFIGYQHIGNNRLVNFMFGFELMRGFTQPLRAFNFDTGSADEGTRNDALTGFRAGWTLPIYKRAPDKYYLY